MVVAYIVLIDNRLLKYPGIWMLLVSCLIASAPANVKASKAQLANINYLQFHP